ncbi:MAG: hypothetical protein QXL78_06800 [Methanocellales archaeon]
MTEIEEVRGFTREVIASLKKQNLLLKIDTNFALLLLMGIKLEISLFL